MKFSPSLMPKITKPVFAKNLLEDFDFYRSENARLDRVTSGKPPSQLVIYRYFREGNNDDPVLFITTDEKKFLVELAQTPYALFSNGLIVGDISHLKSDTIALLQDFLYRLKEKLFVTY